MLDIAVEAEMAAGWDWYYQNRPAVELATFPAQKYRPLPLYPTSQNLLNVLTGTIRPVGLGAPVETQTEETNPAIDLDVDCCYYWRKCCNCLLLPLVSWNLPGYVSWLSVPAEVVQSQTLPISRRAPHHHHRDWHTVAAFGRTSSHSPASQLSAAGLLVFLDLGVAIRETGGLFPCNRHARHWRCESCPRCPDRLSHHQK